MTEHLLNTIYKKRSPIAIYGYGNTNALLKYGNSYRSRLYEEEEGKRNAFIFHFKESAVEIQSYNLMTSIDNVYPTSWIVSVSNDNQTWFNISTINNGVPCFDEHKFLISGRYRCNSTDETKYDANDVKGYFRFLKFNMTANSFFTPGVWIDSVSIDGFEINGNFIISRILKCTPSNKRHHGIILSMNLIWLS